MKKNKSKWHYAVVKSMFGDLWVGKTKKPLKKEIIFATIEEAVDKAQNLFMQYHPDFFPSDEADTEAQYEFDHLAETTEKNCGKVPNDKHIE